MDKRNLTRFFNGTTLAPVILLGGHYAYYFFYLVSRHYRRAGCVFTQFQNTMCRAVILFSSILILKHTTRS